MSSIFHFVNFEPRADINPAVTTLESEIESLLPIDSRFKAVVKFDGRGFHFSAVVQAKGVVLTSDHYVIKNDSSLRERNWQLPILNRVVHDIINQLLNWKLSTMTIEETRIKEKT